MVPMRLWYLRLVLEVWVVRLLGAKKVGYYWVLGKRGWVDPKELRKVP